MIFRRVDGVTGLAIREVLMIESGWFECYIGVAGGAIGAARAKLALVHIGMAAHAGRG